MKKIIILAFILFQACLSQQRYLINSAGDYIRVEKGQSAAEALKQSKGSYQKQTIPACSNRFTYGNTPGLFPPDTNIQLHHKDVVGAWF